MVGGGGCIISIWFVDGDVVMGIQIASCEIAKLKVSVQFL